ncbi:uncharacterized protein LOC124619955 [Schistocerca americana]|uniref:uncharacterized protein LOC124619955 n=1 Tax=Schistocerca americana TaxID=7009 RepID=UPI001F4F9088|nr:uncharacterized protein LOC124619955 [Schistocerca americana]
MSNGLVDRELRSSSAMATATALPNNKLLISSPGKSHHHNNNHQHNNNNSHSEQVEPASPSSSTGSSPRTSHKRSRKSSSAPATPDASQQSNGVAGPGQDTPATSPQPPPPPPPPPAKRRRHHAAGSAGGQPSNPNIRDDMFRNYQPWVIATYGDSAKTKTITLRKHARILRTLRGEETNSVENSKFRFWVKAKGFRMGRPPGYVPKPADSIVGTQALPGQSPHDEPPLYVPVATAKDGMGRERQLFKKVAVVENFFDIIFSVHVEMEGRAGKHAGQKRTYRAITETYAFLPREAVTRFLLGCTDCQRRPRSPAVSRGRVDVGCGHSGRGVLSRARGRRPEGGDRLAGEGLRWTRLGCCRKRERRTKGCADLAGRALLTQRSAVRKRWKKTSGGSSLGQPWPALIRPVNDSLRAKLFMEERGRPLPVATLSFRPLVVEKTPPPAEKRGGKGAGRRDDRKRRGRHLKLVRRITFPPLELASRAEPPARAACPAGSPLGTGAKYSRGWRRRCLSRYTPAPNTPGAAERQASGPPPPTHAAPARSGLLSSASPPGAPPQPGPSAVAPSLSRARRPLAPSSPPRAPTPVDTA